MFVARLLKLSTEWKFPLHGPRNYVDWSWELLACCSARTFLLSRQAPLPYVFKIQPVVFSSKSRSGYVLDPDLLSEVDFCRLCGFIFTDKWRKKIKVSLRKCLKVVGVKVLEGDKRAVCDTCRYSWEIVEGWDVYIDIFVVTKILEEVNALKEIPGRRD